MESSLAFMQQIKLLQTFPESSRYFENIVDQINSEDDWENTLSVACCNLLLPRLTVLVGSHLRPWLPELLHRLANHPNLHVSTSKVQDSANVKASSAGRKQKSKVSKRSLNELETSSNICYSEKYLQMHRAICVAVVKLYPVSPDPVLQFILSYFENHPAPFTGLKQIESSPEPDSKKMKLSTNLCVPNITEENVLEATFELILLIKEELPGLWQWDELMDIICRSSSQSVKWFACQSVAHLCNMTEVERKNFVAKYIDAKASLKFSVFYAHRDQQRPLLVNQLPPIWNSCNTPAIREQKTSKHSSTIAKQNIRKRNRLKKAKEIKNPEGNEICVVMPLRYTTFVGKHLLPIKENTKPSISEKECTLVCVSSSLENLESVWSSVVAAKPVLLEGAVGCGKTALVEHLAAISGRGEAPYLTKVQLGEQTDAKSLLGTYRCTKTPGEFIWCPGALTRAVTHGHWLLLEDIDSAQVDVVSVVVSILEDRKLSVPGSGEVRAHREFRVFATRRLTCDGRRVGAVSGAGGRLEALWSKVLLKRLTRDEMNIILVERYPRLAQISEYLVNIFLMLAPEQQNTAPADNEGTVSTDSVSLCSSSVVGSGRLVCFRDLLKWAGRISAHSRLDGNVLITRAFQEALDCFCAAVPDPETRVDIALKIAAELNITATDAQHLCTNNKPEVFSSAQFLRIGDRVRLQKLPVALSNLIDNDINSTGKKPPPFSFTRKSCLLLERVAVAVSNIEPVLIVGETGTGKTSTVQYLAQQTNNTLKVINMNQQSDSTDLLGGFKPVEMKTVVFPLINEFEGLFRVTMPSEKESWLKFVSSLYRKRRWAQLLELMLMAEKKIKNIIDASIEEMKENLKSFGSEYCTVQQKKRKKLDAEHIKKHDINEEKELKTQLTIKLALRKKWTNLRIRLEQSKNNVDKSQSALAFAFIEGILTTAIVKGDWVLLDEINLANAETLECLSSLLESHTGSLMLLERGDEKPIKRHPNFRLFACMNPASDVGKKELPAGLRNRFTEFFMEDLNENDDLEILIRDYLIAQNPSGARVRSVRELYCELRNLASKGMLVDTTGAAPHFSLRTLCRALRVAAKNPAGGFGRTLYESFCLSFLTQLDRNSYSIVEKLIVKHLILPKDKKESPSEVIMKKLYKALSKCLPHPDRVQDTTEGEDVFNVPDGTVIGNWVLVCGYWIAKGTREPKTDSNYILTKSVQMNLKNVARIVSLGEGCPVLLQGDTSVGKTSLVTYLAQKCGVQCVRINNHEHTDVQEYLGCYAPDESGKLVFREGALVAAIRTGQWIILDELNLAPTDVLEALNRLLDDNRELFLPETRETIRAHPNFRLFATQNPPGLYGGRKVLSRAFRNRFVELHVDDIPGNELVEIIHKRCCLSLQHSEKLVAVLQALQMRRGRENLFQGRHSLVTLRDLFRWAERYHLAEQPEGSGKFYDWEQHLADEGYLVLAGRVRLDEEVAIITQVIEEQMKCRIDPSRLFNLTEATSPVTRSILENLNTVNGFDHLVFTEDMRRLYVLLSKALSFKEPVLLVGETGCGKTTVCQMIAAANEQALHIVNCHMHTEGADFIGGLRPVRDRPTQETEKKLFEWVDGPLICAMRDGGLFLADEISLADDSVLERLNSVLEPERILVLAEKGSNANGNVLETELVTAQESFRLVGTMNPGGDYGKKELSPAMRNRFTEIWCPKIDICRNADDVLQIVQHNLRPRVVIDTNQGCDISIGATMLQFLKLFTKSDLGRKCTISIRDLLTWVQFINKMVEMTTVNDETMDVGLAYIHGACLVLLDGLGAGLTGTGLDGWKDLKKVSLNCLYQQARQLSGHKPDPSTLEESFVGKLRFINEGKKFAVGPFYVEKGSVEHQVPHDQFTFVAHRTCINLVRVLRGLQLNRPLLLEGSPGVGKTSLVVALAKATNNDIVRINLSEQTDVSDLFGADLPVEGAEGGGRFAWRDGPLLQALRKGSWVVLDELNLASQSVLEGLNACFDHRGEVFVPELGQTFKVSHKVTKIFACQNPQHQGGARKGLPRSFLNRFTQVHVEPLSSGDMEFIIRNSYSKRIATKTIHLMVEFNRRLVEDAEQGQFGVVGGPWEFNLRDLFRWCELLLNCDFPRHRQCIDLLYAAKMRTAADREHVHNLFTLVFSDIMPEHVAPLPEVHFQMTKSRVYFGNVSLNRVTSGNQISFGSRGSRNGKSLCLVQSQLPLLQQLAHCVHHGWLVLLTGGPVVGKTAAVQQLAALAGRQLHVFSLTSQMDVGELLGGFEQVDYGRNLGSLLQATGETVENCVKQVLLGPVESCNEGEDCEKSCSDSKVLLAAWERLLQARNVLCNRNLSDGTRYFLDLCNQLGVVLKQTKTLSTRYSRVRSANSDDASEFTVEQRCETLLSHLDELRTKVQNSGTLASGGIFEWVESALVEAVREGRWILVEGASLCAASVLDRLNSLLEPGGSLLMAERGIVEGRVPCVRPHLQFRIFLAIDHTRGEVSRAMRNRGVEIFLPSSPLVSACAAENSFYSANKDYTSDLAHSSRESDSDDPTAPKIPDTEHLQNLATGRYESVYRAPFSCLSDCVALLVAQGMTCSTMQASLLFVHESVSRALPGYLQPGVPLLLKTAHRSVQLQYAGEEAHRALCLACHQCYARAHSSSDIQCKVLCVLKTCMQQVYAFMMSGEDSELTQSELVLRTRSLQLHGSAVTIALQISEYVRMALLTQNSRKNGEKTLLLPNSGITDKFPDFTSFQAEVLVILLASVPMTQWKVILECINVALKEVSSASEIVAAIKKLIRAYSKGLLTDAGLCDLLHVDEDEYSADPRFCIFPVKRRCGVSEEHVTSVSNKICIGMWQTLQVVKPDDFSHILPNLPQFELASSTCQTLLELSNAIYEKKLNQCAAFHPSIVYLREFFIQLNKLIKSFYKTSNRDQSFANVEYLQLQTLLYWRDRFWALCSRPITKQMFLLLRPVIKIHWHMLQDLFSKSILSILAPEKLQRTIKNITSTFKSNCGPIRSLSENLCKHLVAPLPFASSVAAELQSLILKLEAVLTPDLLKESLNAFLASESCRDVKMQLVHIASRFYQNRSKAEPLLLELQALQRFLQDEMKRFTETSQNIQERKYCFMKVQSWPLIDYLVGTLLSWLLHKNLSSEIGSHVNFVKELLAISPSLPLELLNNSKDLKSWSSAILSRALSSSTCASNPSLWCSYPSVSNTDDSEVEEVKIVRLVYSPMQCLLTYILSMSNAEEALSDITLGLFSEKLLQLRASRATLWSNWLALTDDSLSPSVMFASSVIRFAENFFSAALKATTVDSGGSSSDLPGLFENVFEIFDKTNNLHNQLTPLLRVIKGCYRDILEIRVDRLLNSVKIVTIAKFGAAVGALHGWVTGHLEAIDPAQKRLLFLHYAERDSNRLQQELVQFCWIYLLRGGHSSFDATEEVKLFIPDQHPHEILKRRELHDIEATKVLLKNKQAFRPDETDYNKLVEDIDHFLRSAFSPKHIVELIDMLANDTVPIHVIEQIDRKLITFDNFFSHIYRQYPLYCDVTAPFMEGLSLVTNSLRVMNAHARTQSASAVCGADITSILVHLSSFPFVRDSSKPLDSAHEARNSIESLEKLLESYGCPERNMKKCQSMALRSLLFELQAARNISGIMGRDAALILREVVGRALEWWRKQEDERKRKEEEEASLYRYKAREHAKNETEEETIAREYAQAFPNYNDDFSDLNDEDLEKISGKSEIQIEKCDNWLSEHQLWEIIEVHCDLLATFTCPLHRSAITKNFLVSAALERLKIVHTVVNYCGPIAHAALDQSCIGAHLLLNYNSCLAFEEPQALNDSRKPFNFYTDGRPSEATDLRSLLLPLLSKINELLLKWPEHPSLLLLVRVAERILEYPVSSPLAKLLAGLESLLLKSEIWEANAHRGVSLLEYLTPIEKKVVHWRTIELMEWKNCLDNVAHANAVSSKVKWWPFLHETLQLKNYSEESIEHLTSALQTFMDSSTLGDFESNLSLIFTFHKQLQLSDKRLTSVDNLLFNIYKYYQQFVPRVQYLLKKERNDIDVRVKESVRIANYSVGKYNDIRHVRSVVKKSCEALHSQMRRWKKYLQTQNKALWRIDSVDELKLAEGIWDTPKNDIAFYESVLPCHPVDVVNFHVDVDSVLCRVSQYSKKSHSFVLETVTNLPYIDCVECIEEISTEIISSYQKLTAEAAAASAENEKDARISRLKSVMKMRRSCFSRLLKQLSEMGIKAHKGQTLWNKSRLNEALLISNTEMNNFTFENSVFDAVKKLWPGCDKYFYRCINRFELLEDSLKVPHQELNIELIKQMRGVSKHLVLMAIDLRREMALLAENLSTLTSFLQDISCAEPVSLIPSDEAREVFEKLHAVCLSLALSASETQAVLETKPSGIGLLPISEAFSWKISSENLTEMHRRLDLCKEICSNVANTSLTLLSSFTEPSKPRIVGCNVVQEVKRMHSELKNVAKNVEESVLIVAGKNEGYVRLSEVLIAWLRKWKSVDKTILRFTSCTERTKVDCYNIDKYKTEIEDFTNILLCSIQALYKKYVHSAKIEGGNLLIRDIAVDSVINDIKSLRLNYALKCLRNLVNAASSGVNPEMNYSLKQLRVILQQYQCLCSNLLLAASGNSRSLCKLLSVLLAVFNQVATNGFCKPQDMEELEGGQGKLSFEDQDDSDAAGLAEGEGKKDMADKFESEDQLESALKDGEQEKPGDKDIEEEEGGIEMNDDFEGKLQDKEQAEEVDDEDEDQQESTLDQMGQTEPGSETLDTKLWNDKDEIEQNNGLEEDNNASGNDNDMESQVVAKEQHKKQEKNDKNRNEENDGDEEDRRKRVEPEIMDEDIRQPNKETTNDEYDDEFQDEYAGEKPKKVDEPPIDIPDDLNLDAAEEEEGEDETPVDHELDVEKRGIFPEGADLDEKEEQNEDENMMEDLPEEENKEKEEDSNSEEAKLDEMEGTNKEFETEQVDDDGDENQDNEPKKLAGQEAGNNTEENKEEECKEKADASNDRDTNTGAESAPIDAVEASKDKTKGAPETDDAGRQFDDSEQKDFGEEGQRTNESEGVGESHAPQPVDEDIHLGKESSVATQRKDHSSQSEEQSSRLEKKPGEVDEQKVTGNPESEVREGLLTCKKNDGKEKPSDDKDYQDDNDNEEAEKYSSLWQVVRHAEEHCDTQVVDAGTRDQAVEAPAPVQEDDADKPEEEGVQQVLMQVDEPEEEIESSKEQKSAEEIANEGREHRQGQAGSDGQSLSDEQDVNEDRLVTEGEEVLEHTVERPPETYFHTLLEEEKLIREIQFEEDLESISQRLQASALNLQCTDQVSCESWAQHQSKAAPYAAILCDQLRLILEPTEAARLRGDYKTGKRLNMRKVISYIASNFLKDKIWLRRTQPSKRTYHVLLAVDDSQSMQTSKVEDLAKQSISLVAQALTKLEVGKVGVLSFGESTSVLHSLDEPFSDAAGAKVFANLRFDQKKSRFVELLRSSVALLRQARGGTVASSETAQILIIISDGQTHARSEDVRAAVRAARNDHVFVVFFVLDCAENHSFYDIKVWDKETCSLQPMAEQFPFPYFLVVRELSTLPMVLADALRRWFELVTADATL